MSVPPPPGPYGPPPQPPNGLGPWGWQQPWPQSPRKNRGASKWILGSIALVAVIAVTVAITVMTIRSDGGGMNRDPSPLPAPDIASANDLGPISIITEEPSCPKWTEVATQLANQSLNGWDRRNPSIPSTEWTAEQRSQFEAVGLAMQSASDQTIPLVSQTPHRVVRELYEQFIAYARAYARAISEYTERDESLARVAINSSSVLTAICASITYGSAGSVAAAVSAPEPPSDFGPPANPADPLQFLTVADPVCTNIKEEIIRFDSETTEWRALDAGLRASELTQSEARVRDQAAATFTDFASVFEQVARRSTNLTLNDFSTLVSQYLEAYATSVPTYTSADSYIAKVATSTGAILNHACLAAAG